MVARAILAYEAEEVDAWKWGTGIPSSPPICEMHIKIKTSLASFILIIQYIEDTKDPFWAGLATRVPK